MSREAILFFPFAYGFNTRAKTIIHKVAFLLYIIGPIFMNVLFMRAFKIKCSLFMLAFSGMYIVYEIGYIYNDIYTTKKEVNPTRWLKTEQMEKYAEDHYPLLVSIRVIYLTIIIWFVLESGGDNVLFYATSLVLLYFTFSFHNFFRGPINALTDGILNLLKYLSPLIIFAVEKSDLRFFLYLFLEVPLARMLGYVIGKKYALFRLAKINVDIRRVFYYFILTVIAAVMSFFDKNHIWFLYGSLYMILYRILCLFLSKQESINNTRWKNEDRNGS